MHPICAQEHVSDQRRKVSDAVVLNLGLFDHCDLLEHLDVAPPEQTGFVTTDNNHKFNIAPNLLDRDFAANQSNQKWPGDISYIWTGEGWLYLAVALKLHSRRVIGWAASHRTTRDLAIRALNRAISHSGDLQAHHCRAVDYVNGL